MNINRVIEKSMNKPFVSIFATLIIFAILGLTLKRLPHNNVAAAATGNLLGVLEKMDAPITSLQTPEEKAQEQFPRERTLYANPTATIYLDGLMVFCHDGNTFQAGVHTATEKEHVVTVVVRKKGQKDPILSKQFTHQQIKNMRPLHLYVEGANGKPLDAGAELFEKNNASLRQSFANVLDFQSAEFNGAGLKLAPGVLVPINILQGKFYSATLVKIAKKKAGASDLPVSLGKRASLVAADLTQDSGAIVMAYNDRRKELFRLPLNSSTQYEINILNEPPEEQHHSQSSECQLKDCECPNDPHKNHFPDYYKAFDPKTFSDKLIVCLDNDEQQGTGLLSTFPTTPPVSTAVNKLAPGATTPFAMLWRPPSPGRRMTLFTVDDPPCIQGWVSNIPRLPDWP
jgi:hypothetical protein